MLSDNGGMVEREGFNPSMLQILQDPYAKEAFSPSQKREIRKIQNHTCQMCGARENPNKRKFQVHHEQPLSRGGKDDLNNAELVCPTDHLIANRMFLQFGITWNQLQSFITEYGKRTK